MNKTSTTTTDSLNTTSAQTISIALIGGISGGVIVLILIGIVVLYCVCKKSKAVKPEEDSSEDTEETTSV
jgi:hypothetical protein